jgi:hypothetical protein
MKISDQTKYIRDSIEPWARTNGGTGEVARGIIHFFGILSTKQGSFRFAVKFKGEDKRGDYEEAGMFDRKFWIAFSYGESMQIEKGKALVGGQAGGRPLFDMVEELRQIIRGLQFDAERTEVTPNYLGCHELVEVSPDNIGLIDGFYLEFTIGCIAEAPNLDQQEGD